MKEVINMIERNTYLTNEEKKIIDESIDSQIDDLKKNLEDSSKFKKKNLLDKIHIVKEGDSNGNE